MTKRQDLKKRYAAAAKLRTKKVDQIRKLLGIPSDPAAKEAVEFIAQWRGTGHVSVETQLKAKAQRLLREWHSIHMACIEIQDELARLGQTATPRRITAAE